MTIGVGIIGILLIGVGDGTTGMVLDGDGIQVGTEIAGHGIQDGDGMLGTVLIGAGVGIMAGMATTGDGMVTIIGMEII